MDDVGTLTPLADVIHQIVAMCGNAIAIVLIGSAARGKRTESSDVDLLVIGSKTPILKTRVPGFHVQTTSQANFLTNLGNGEDFEAWCVRYGQPMHDNGLWKEIMNSPSVNRWPEWQPKVVHGARRLFLAATLLRLGDKDAAREELIYVLGHAARGLLIKAGIFPLSRPELAAQLKQLGYLNLARLHEKLRSNDPASVSLLRQAQIYSKKLLCHLDPSAYKKSSEQFRKNQQAKQRHPRSSPARSPNN
jgi:hypothetical protein